MHSLCLIFGLRDKTMKSASSRQTSSDKARRAAERAQHASGDDAAQRPASALGKLTSGLKALLFGGRTLRILTLAALTDNLVDLTWSLQPVFATEECGLSATQYGT